MRRDKNDEKWQECKRIVYNLDQSRCLLCKCLSVKEAMIFRNSNPEWSTTTIDPAHHYPVSLRPDLMYDPNNVFCLCRAHHERIDHTRDPITGDFCDSKRTEYWWSRIIQERNKNTNKVELPTFYDDEQNKTSEDSEVSNEFFYADI